jgi:hypothetical protein
LRRVSLKRVRFWPIMRRQLIGKGSGILGSPNSMHVMRSDYQIRCSKRVEIIKLDGSSLYLSIANRQEAGEVKDASQPDLPQGR